jgi:divalent metal cation (Fe/Co/Zn/Cd) transporter
MSGGNVRAAPASPVLAPSRSTLERRARQLAYATIGWNSLEAIVAIASGLAVRSVALVGFGLDSVVEVGSAIVIAWQFRGASAEKEERALRLVALSFFALGGYIVFDSVRSLAAREAPEASVLGIVIAILSLVVMPALAWAKRRTAADLHSRTVAADSRQTMLCTYLSAVLLIGLVLNAWAGWWWADPFAAIVIAGVAINEGREAWTAEAGEDGCCP